MEQEGVTVYRINRGGDVTYHGPGQLVGYPIIDLRGYGRDAHSYLRNVEEVLIRTLKAFGLESTRKKEYTGVWVDNRKVAAISIAVSRWVTMHGFALNVTPNLGHFSLIIPCGISEFGVTSLAKEMNRQPNMEEVKMHVVHSFSTVFTKESLVEYTLQDLL